MPLHLNLLHEIETQRAASRRDPLKIAIYILLAIVAVFAGMYFWQVGKAASINRQHAALKAEFDRLDPLARAAEKREAELKEIFETSEKFVQSIEGRFYWAPMVEQIVKMVPREVQISKMSASVQGDAVKRVTFNFDGVAAGKDPRSVAEALRQSFIETLGKKYQNVTANFRLLEDNATSVVLDGKTLPTAAFGIAVSLQAGEEPTAASAAAGRH
jgi:Tfp pilus assembly protein PilN